MHGSDRYVPFGRNLREVCCRIDVPFSSVGTYQFHSEMKMLPGGSCSGVAGDTDFSSGVDGITGLDSYLRQVHIGCLILGAVRSVILQGHTLAAAGVDIMIDTDDAAVILGGKKAVTLTLNIHTLVELRLPRIHRVFAVAIRRGYKHELVSLDRERIMA